MAKTIINKPNVSPKFETICEKCDTHFKFDKSDTYPHVSHDRDGQSTYHYVDCPNCGYSIGSEGITNPPRNGAGLMGGYTKLNVQQLVFRNVDVSKLRQIENDDEFKHALINMILI